MITKVTGRLVRLQDGAATIAVGAFEYEVFIPEFVRRQLQDQLDQEISLRTIEFFEGNPQQGRLIPRMVGFRTEAEREFFDLFCSVDGVGVKKALRAMVRPVQEVATAIEEQDVKQLSTLPGIGPAVSERVVAKLRRKMARFALLVSRDMPEDASGDSSVIAQTAEALVSLGHTPLEARKKIEEVTGTDGGKKFKSVEDLLTAIYRRQSSGS
ncbi:MAG: Holliday junction DNA helicase RuvA [Planctomycetaceae bacterium]|nr:Holliday junction DNA helicase RuvA [Planctomycetaceae bacterium]